MAILNIGLITGKLPIQMIGVVAFKLPVNAANNEGSSSGDQVKNPINRYYKSIVGIG